MRALALPAISIKRLKSGAPPVMSRKPLVGPCEGAAAAVNVMTKPISARRAAPFGKLCSRGTFVVLFFGVWTPARLC
jgi:hypothetical protein